MQKIISTFLLCFSIFLLFLSMTAACQSSIQHLPPFADIPSVSIPEPLSYTGRDFSIKSEKEVPAQMYAKAYCLMDANSNRVLLGKEENKKMPMASTTKIMTCILALEYGNPDSKVRVSDYAASMPDVQLNMQPDDTFYLKDLLYSLMLESHNDTAVAIAEHIGQSVEGFADMMNEKASQLGCTSTNFVTPNGLDDDKHYTTAKELCLIAGYAIQNKDFLDIIQTKSYSFTNCDKSRSYTVRNHDAFLTSYPGAIGIKTGFTGNAGYCFCGAAQKNGQTLVSSVLACGWPPNKSYKWSDTKKLMDYGFANFRKITVNHQKLPASLPVTDGIKNTIGIVTDCNSKTNFMLSETDKLTIKSNLPSAIKAPVRQGDILGYEEYYLNGSQVCQFPIIAKQNVPKRTLSYFTDIICHLFFFAYNEI
ncbi:MAG: D-alanyl-D-alanine carboxypeptidase family protein [Butyribacter sp.]|nr:D-alanyl-D-alanine carboxypeptidase family protein [Butyribacter sp.]